MIYRLDYCDLMMKLKRGKDTRKVFDRALQALPVTQHRELWNLYVSWVKGFGVSETAIRVFRRYIMYDPGCREEYIEYLETIGQHEEAARQLTLLLNDEHYVSPSAKTHHQLWMDLCKLCSTHPESVVDAIKVENIIRSGICKFSDEVGKLWNSLADYYVGLGQFEKARTVYEEAISSVSTVRDFTIVFDSYVKVEESILSAKMRFLEEIESNSAYDSSDIEEESSDITVRLARIEYLMDKRPLFLNSVLLRQNPHNCHEWLKRVKLLKDDIDRSILTFEEAVQTIDPTRALGKLSSIFISWALVLEESGNICGAENVFDIAVKTNFKNVDELASVWCSWAEMLLRLERFDTALEIMRKAVEPLSSDYNRKDKQGRELAREGLDVPTSSTSVSRNVKVWSLLLDLEESFGTFESCKVAYNRVMDLKVVTAQMAINYANFLEEHHYFEDSFQVYEKAVSLFEFPQLKTIWMTYLDKFTERYGGLKLERLRDLFEQAVVKVPANDAAEFYVKYARAEQLYGLSRHVISILERATKVVPESQRLQMYRLYIKKVEVLFGIMKTRPVYEKAMKELSDAMCKELCIDYANMEKKMGEIDRARAIFIYGSQFADPKRDLRYWKVWQDFEESVGNEETFREMLRVQRSVEVAYSHVNYVAINLSDSSPATIIHVTDDTSATNSINKDTTLKRKFVLADSACSPVEEADSVEQRVKNAKNEEELDI